MKFKIALLTCVVLASLNSVGKENKIKFGKIEKKDLEMQVYENDTSASAVVLYENGESVIEYSKTNGWRLVFKKHQRIKILKKEGVSYGDFQIGLSKSHSDRESLNRLKAITFNLEQGKIVKSELEKKDVHLEEVNKGFLLESFTLPDVKVGSIIDVKYDIDCKKFFRNMRPWKFQHNIPVVYSEYLVIVPEYFHFRKFVLGFEKFELYDETSSSGSINLSNTYKTGGNLSNPLQTHVEHNTVSFQNNKYHWIAKDLPAFETESYISTVDNYIQQVQFELQSMKFPQSDLYNYSQSWESINEELTEDEDFGKNVFGSFNFLKDEVAGLIKDCKNNNEKVCNIVNHVHSNYKFNDSFSIYSKGLKKVYKDKNGNVADLNFLMAAMLSKAGFEVKPVILSTRANGMFLFPTVTSFNYVVIQCDIDGNKVLLDAADEFCGINQIPFYCLNGQGLVVGGKKPEWIELLNIGKSDLQYASELQMDGQGKISGKLRVKRSGYSALGFRSKVGDFNSTEKYLDDFSEKKTDWEIDNHSIEGLDSLDKYVEQRIDLSLNNASVFAGDRIYISPVIFNPDKENPFKLKERKYPVDFGYKFRENEMNILTIPSGYTIEEIPEPIALSLPERKAVFMFSVNKIGENKVQTVSTVMFNNSVFLPEDYENLKELYNNIIEKHQQQIILKKT